MTGNKPRPWRVLEGRDGLRGEDKKRRFERLVLPHMDAAHNLAFWIIRNREEAEEAVQEAMLRAFRFFDGLRGDDAKAWLLGIVRNTCYTLHARAPDAARHEAFDEDIHTAEEPLGDPERAALARADSAAVNRALAALPAKFREVLVLRELEGLSYREIAAVAQVPMGTVMSRLARARSQLRRALAEGNDKDRKT